MRYDLHTHYYPKTYFDAIRELATEYSFDTDPTGRSIIKYKGSRFFGITPPMTDPQLRIEEMDRAGIDVEVISLSTPNVYFADAEHQPEIVRLANDEYAELLVEMSAGRVHGLPEPLQRLRLHPHG